MNTYFRCLESRMDKNNTLYGKFSLDSILSGQGNTFANSLRRSLFSDLSGLAITHFCITSKPGLSYEFATLPGLTESILDFSLNLKKVVLTGRVIDYEMQAQENSSNIDGKGKSFPLRSKIAALSFSVLRKKLGGNASAHGEISYPNQVRRRSKIQAVSATSRFERKGQKTTLPIAPIGFLKAKGPAVLRAKDLILPPGIRCVHPDQYLGTIAADGALSIKFLVAAGKGFIVQDETLYNSLSRAKLLLKSNILPEASFGSKPYTLPLLGVPSKDRQMATLPNSVLSSMAKQAINPEHTNIKSKPYSGDLKQASLVVPKKSIFFSTADKTFLDQRLIGRSKNSLSNATSTYGRAELEGSKGHVDVNSLFKDNKKSIQINLPYSAISKLCVQKKAKQFYLLAFWSKATTSNFALPPVLITNPLAGLPSNKSKLCQKVDVPSKNRLISSVAAFGPKLKGLTLASYLKVKARGLTSMQSTLKERQLSLVFGTLATQPLQSIPKLAKLVRQASSYAIQDRPYLLGTLPKVTAMHKNRDITKLLVSLSPTIKNQKFKKIYCRAKQAIGRSQSFLPLNKNISGSFSNIYLGKSDSSKKLLKKQLIWSAEETLYPVLSLDVTFTPISKVNFQINVNRNSEKNQETIIFEIWTNGSITPKRAIQESCLILAQDFYNLFCRVNEFSSLQFWWKRESTESKITSLARPTVEDLYPAMPYKLTPNFLQSTRSTQSTSVALSTQSTSVALNTQSSPKGTTTLGLKAASRSNAFSVKRLPVNFYTPIRALPKAATVSPSNRGGSIYWRGLIEGCFATVRAYSRKGSKLLKIEDFYSTPNKAKQMLLCTAYKNFRRKKDNRLMLNQKLSWFNKIIIYPIYAKGSKSSVSVKMSKDNFMTTSLPSSYARALLEDRSTFGVKNEARSTPRALPQHSLAAKLAQRCTLVENQRVASQIKAPSRPSFANRQIAKKISKTNFRSHSQIKNCTKVQFPESKNLRLKQKVHYLHAFWRLNVSDLNFSLETQLILKKLNVNSVYDLHFFILRKSWSLFLNCQQQNEIIKIYLNFGLNSPF